MTATPRSVRRLLMLATLVTAAAAGCAARQSGGAAGADSPETPAAELDSAQIERLTRVTAPDAPRQIMFDWSLQDRDVRVQGKGVLRVQGPYHARLDLFGPQDVEFVRAVLVRDSLEYLAAARNVPLPPVAFLWSLLGVFRAPAAELTGMTQGAAGLTLRYMGDGGSWQFRADSASLRSVEWQGGDGGRRTVELAGPFTESRPARAVFRDWREFRELTLTVTATENVPPFDPGVWNVSIQ